MIFLSASIPTQAAADRKYYRTADIVAIREAVKALAMVILPRFQLVWGGHPAISPMIKYVLESQEIKIRERIILYQSKRYQGADYVGNYPFGQLIEVEPGKDRDESLAAMRFKMLNEHEFQAGVFIGGRLGVEQEFELFRSLHPDTPVFPIASTGAAALKIFQSQKDHGRFGLLLKTETAYLNLFQQLFADMNGEFENVNAKKA